MSRQSLPAFGLRSFVPILLLSVLTAAILAGVGGAATRMADGSTGLVAAYSFDEGSGTIAADTSGNANTGTISGATWSTVGNMGGALAFNGSSSTVRVPDSASLDLTSGMTLEAWVRPTAVGTAWRTVLF
jgi:hypothetical protein